MCLLNNHKTKKYINLYSTLFNLIFAAKNRFPLSRAFPVYIILWGNSGLLSMEVAAFFKFTRYRQAYCTVPVHFTSKYCCKYYTSSTKNCVLIAKTTSPRTTVLLTKFRDMYSSIPYGTAVYLYKLTPTAVQ
jgi:hypothetical protein